MSSKYNSTLEKRQIAFAASFSIATDKGADGTTLSVELGRDGGMNGGV
jgi:hypothetical protein